MSFAGAANSTSIRQSSGAGAFESWACPRARSERPAIPTDIEVLESLIDKHPVIEKLIEYRRLTKIKALPRRAAQNRR